MTAAANDGWWRGWQGLSVVEEAVVDCVAVVADHAVVDGTVVGVWEGATVTGPIV